MDDEIVKGPEGLKKIIQNGAAGNDLEFNIFDPTMLTDGYNICIKMLLVSTGRPLWTDSDLVTRHWMAIRTWRRSSATVSWGAWPVTPLECLALEVRVRRGGCPSQSSCGHWCRPPNWVEERPARVTG